MSILLKYPTVYPQGMSSVCHSLFVCLFVYLFVCFIISALPLTMKKLNILKWTDKSGQPKTLRLRDEMSPKWHDAGELLDLTTANLECISAKHRGDVRECLRDVLRDWVRSDSSDYPATWGGLLSLLDDLQLHACAKSLQAALECSPDS